jgi:hypothetical protein
MPPASAGPDVLLLRLLLLRLPRGYCGRRERVLWEKGEGIEGEGMDCRHVSYGDAGGHDHRPADQLLKVVPAAPQMDILALWDLAC